MAKRKKWFDGVVIGLIGFIVLLTALYAFTADAWIRRSKAELNKLRARGEPVTIEDIIPDPIPNGSNAATVYNRAFKVLRSSTYKSSDKDAISDVLDARKRNADLKTWANAKGALSRNQVLLRAIDEAVQRPECQFDVKWEDGYAALFNHMGGMRELGRLEAANALVKAHDGEVDEAVESIITGIRLSESIGQEPVVISQMVRWITLKSACDMIRASAGMNGMTRTQALEMDAALARVDLHAGFMKSMRTERVMGLAAYDEIRRDGPQRFSNYVAIDPDDNITIRIVTSKLGRPVLYADKLVFLRSINKLIELSNKPYYKTASIAYKANPANNGPSYTPVSKALCSWYDKYRMSYETERAHLAVTRTALGIMAYKDRYKAYPKTLAELKSRLGWDMHKDPFSGKDLLYRKTAKGFIIYSIGANISDDGGKAPPANGSDPYSADVVWEYQER